MSADAAERAAWKAAAARQSPYGPFIPALDPTERACRFRSLASLAAVLIPPCATRSALIGALRRAEKDDEAVPVARDLLEGLTALARRRILSSYAEIHRPG